MKRDFFSSLSLEKRHFMSLSNINEYNIAMTIATFEVFSQSLKIISMDTETMSLNEANLVVAEKVLEFLHAYELEKLKNALDKMIERYEQEK